jgi:hypothetical protein
MHGLRLQRQTQFGGNSNLVRPSDMSRCPLKLLQATKPDSSFRAVLAVLRLVSSCECHKFCTIDTRSDPPGAATTQCDDGKGSCLYWVRSKVAEIARLRRTLSTRAIHLSRWVVYNLYKFARRACSKPNISAAQADTPTLICAALTLQATSDMVVSVHW